jgi:ABC-type transporter Mla maintaining outer membrane lipid asymmetry ATPase subunit MlaF
MTNPAIAANGLHKCYGDKVVLDGIGLTVPQSTIFSLLGPDGAGKTDLHHLSRDEGRLRTVAELLERFDLVKAARKPAGACSGGVQRTQPAGQCTRHGSRPRPAHPHRHQRVPAQPP